MKTIFSQLQQIFVIKYTASYFNVKSVKIFANSKYNWNNKLSSYALMDRKNDNFVLLLNNLVPSDCSFSLELNCSSYWSVSI